MKSYKYDEKGRLIMEYLPTIDLLIEYKYKKDGRFLKLSCKNNPTNSVTLIKQKNINGEWLDAFKKEYGEKIITTIIYDDNGKEIYQKKFNKIKSTIFVKKTFNNIENNTSIWITYYQGETNIGFKVLKEKLRMN
jgi:hypothetical protein